MKILFFCIAIAAFALADAKKCEMKKAGINGDVMQRLETKDLSTCKKKCIALSKCMAATYKKKEKKCTLHSDVNPDNFYDADKSVRVFGKECVNGVPVRIETVSCGPNSRKVGEQCICNEGFRMNNGQCQAEVVCPANSRRVGDGCVCNQGYNMIGGQCKVNDPFLNTYCVMNDINCPGNDNSHHTGVADIKACQLLCDQSSGCQGAQYRNDGHCWLKRGHCPNPQGEAGIHISLKIAKGGSCAQHIYANDFCLYARTNCPFHDIADFHGTSMAQCQEKCRNQPGCVGVVHNNAQRCYLKRICGLRLPVIFGGTDVAMRRRGHC